MMYQIAFDYSTAKWQVKFRRMFPFPWHPVVDGGTDRRPSEPLKFDTYDEAKQYVSRVGIDKAYDRVHTRSYATLVSSGPIPPDHGEGVSRGLEEGIATVLGATHA